jgi:hypothetical protein
MKLYTQATPQVHAETVRSARAAMRRAGFQLADLKSLTPHQQAVAARQILALRDHNDRMAKQKAEARRERRKASARLTAKLQGLKDTGELA